MSMAPAETAAAAERYSRKIRKIDGVICVAADAPVTAATVAQRLRLPGLPVHVAELACDKLAMKRCFRRPAWRCPGSRKCARRRNCSASPSSAGRDLVIKPVDQPRAAAACSAWRKSKTSPRPSCWRVPIRPASG